MFPARARTRVSLDLNYRPGYQLKPQIGQEQNKTDLRTRLDSPSKSLFSLLLSQLVGILARFAPFYHYLNLA